MLIGISLACTEKAPWIYINLHQFYSQLFKIQHQNIHSWRLGKQLRNAEKRNNHKKFYQVCVYNTNYKEIYHEHWMEVKKQGGTRKPILVSWVVLFSNIINQQIQFILNTSINYTVRYFSHFAKFNTWPHAKTPPSTESQCENAKWLTGRETFWLAGKEQTTPCVTETPISVIRVRKA